MKKKDLKITLEALRPIKMPAIEDKSLRADVISIHLALIAQGRKYDSDIADLRNAHMGAFEKEQEALDRLHMEYNDPQTTPDRKAAILAETNGKKYEQYNNAFREFVKAVTALGEQEISLPKTVDGVQFAEALSGQDFPLEVLDKLYPIFTNDGAAQPSLL